MYHERTQSEIRARRARGVIVTLVALVLIAALVIGTLAFQKMSREQGTASIRESILSTAMQCYAIEGSYPSSLSHLEDAYGLTVNHDDYIINYEWFADNIPPSVAVSVR